MRRHTFRVPRQILYNNMLSFEHKHSTLTTLQKLPHYCGGMCAFTANIFNSDMQTVGCWDRKVESVWTNFLRRLVTGVLRECIQRKMRIGHISIPIMTSCGLRTFVRLVSFVKPSILGTLTMWFDKRTVAIPRSGCSQNRRGNFIVTNGSCWRMPDRTVLGAFSPGRQLYLHGQLWWSWWLHTQYFDCELSFAASTMHVYANFPVDGTKTWFSQIWAS